MSDDPWEGVVGQATAQARLMAAAAQPVHAYLFVGPRGVGKRAAAMAFAGELLAATTDDPVAEARHRKLARGEHHPDVFVLEPEGRALLVEEAAVLITEASRSPVESSRKVIVCDRFHTAEPRVAPKLLKAIEEPPPSTVFVLLAESVLPDQVTIASRCVRIDFDPVGTEAIESWLLGRGVEAGRAAEVAAASGGSVDRAALLVDDPRFVARRDAWRSVPDRLDGTGGAVAVIVAEIRELIDEAQGPLVKRHADELAELEQREAELGTRGSGRRQLDQRQRREVRLLRDDELRFGLATLAARYRERLTDEPAAVTRAVERIDRACAALSRNPSEGLLLQALLVDLGT